MNEKLPGYRTLAPGELVLISTLKIDLATAILKALNNTRVHVNNQRAQAGNLRRIADDPVVDLDALAKVGITDTNRAWVDIRGELYERATAEIARIDAAQPERWIAVANTHFQQGLMALVRAVAQPEGF